MKQYEVTGMSCAACSARVEKAVSQVPGVTACSVSLLTNSMGVEGQADPMDIVAAVEAAGYGAEEKNSGNQKKSSTVSTMEEQLKGQRDACFEEKTGSVSLFFNSAYVCFDGTYDVGMAFAGNICQKSYCSRNFSTFDDRNCYGN